MLYDRFCKTRRPLQNNFLLHISQRTCRDTWLNHLCNYSWGENGGVVFNLRTGRDASGESGQADFADGRVGRPEGGGEVGRVEAEAWELGQVDGRQIRLVPAPLAGKTLEKKNEFIYYLDLITASLGLKHVVVYSKMNR